MAELHKLSGEKLLIDDNGARLRIVELLESLLAQAKRGEIISLAVSVVLANHEIGTMTRGDNNNHLLTAATTYLLHDLVEHTKK